MARPRYGQVVVGPPGSGKTTYCNGMQEYLRLLGRQACVVNLDPANEQVGPDHGHAETTSLPYEALLDVSQEIVSLASVMERMNLGPNGGLLYCAEYLEAHANDIISILRSRLSDTSYLIFDLPGQAELYTHSTCVQNLLNKLAAALELRLTVVQLVDATYCTDVTKFLSAALLGTTTMIRLELPAVSVLSKVDLVTDGLPLQLDYFTECHDLDRLLPFLDQQPNAWNAAETQIVDDEYLDDPDYQRARRKLEQSKLHRKHAKLHEAIAEIVDDFGLLSFLPLDISSAESVGRVLARIDKSNGYIFTQNSVNEDLFRCAIQDTNVYEATADVRERIAAPERIRELDVSSTAKESSST